MDGYEVCRRLKQDKATEHIPVIFVTIIEDKESLIKGYQVGGVDYITKPIYEKEVLIRVETHLKNSLLTQQLLQKNRELQEQIARREQAENALQKADEQLSLISQQEVARWGIDAFVGKSDTIKTILDEVRQLQSISKTSVLIVGESGTGKELIARAIHFGGERTKGPFIPVNCSAIPSELAESYLFGHVRGAFTGADRNKKGYFEVASGGTLFLDEIGEMPLSLQPKFLRVLEDGVVIPMGATDGMSVNVRILAATNVDLQEKVAEGEFRRDLYHRLAVFPVFIPPLRKRPEDIPLLTEHFLSMFATEMNIEKPAISPEAMNALEAYHFPGNVRGLKNIIERAIIKSAGSVIETQHLLFDAVDAPSDHTATEDESPLDKKQIEQLMIQRAQKPNAATNGQAVQSPLTDEQKILAYVKEHGSISNSECRKILSVDRHRANYLLQKMHRYGLLAREGELRWMRYRLPA